VGSCCGFGSIAERHFTEQIAMRELTHYRKEGPNPTTRLLRDALVSAGRTSGSLLDIGAGIGAMSFELVDAGIDSAVGVDASSAYIDAARHEAERRGRSASVQFVHGDFLSTAPQLRGAKIVALDRVVCCYPEYVTLLVAALEHAEECLVLSYPRNLAHVRLAVVIENVTRRIKGDPFRTFVHSTAGMERLIVRAGFQLVSRNCTWMWAADVYVRRSGQVQTH
jgi:SAM-dependent methyltransferase